MRCLTHPQQLPDDVHDWYYKTFGVEPTAETLSHLRRELFHAVWLIMLDSDLMHAYLYGKDVEFWDHILRIVFPRFFTYTLDYLEK